MMRVDWLPQVLQDAGLTVEVLPGALTRGESRIVVNAVIGHHTATGPSWPDGAVANLLRDGRPDLPGPLAQLGLTRKGVLVVVATGRCNHNGYGAYGNDAIGIEAYNDGKGEAWPAVQLDAFDRAVAAILAKVGHTVARYLGHRESDPSRKPDPVGIDLDAQRNRVRALLQGEDDMDEATLRRVLNEATATGQQSWASTEKATLGTVQKLVNEVNALKAAIAAMQPGVVNVDAIATSVADKLAARLKD